MTSFPLCSRPGVPIIQKLNLNFFSLTYPSIWVFALCSGIPLNLIDKTFYLIGFIYLFNFQEPLLVFLFSKHFLMFFIFTVFFPLLFSPLILSPTLPCNHQPVIHVHESFFPLAWSLPPLPPAIAAILLSIYESVSMLHVSSVCSLDSTYEWNHIVLVFLWLAYFT